jgi:hypothetical protein
MLKEIDFTQPVIPANGKEYKILKELPIARFKELDAMEVEFYYGVDMQTMFNKLKEAFEAMNKSKIADASVKVHNLMKGIADKVDKREHIVIRICSLFLVTEDEDVTKWDEDLAVEKGKDWAAEGYSMSSFFSLVANFLPGFLKNYEEVLGDTLNQKPKQTKASKA